ncbi:hypothetical protein ACFLRY_03250 [Bacteroidota bacterium]
MNNLEIKQNLVDHCISKQKEVIEHAKNAMMEAQKSANEYGQPKDRYDSFRNKMLRERDLHAKQLDKAIEKLSILNRLIPVRQSDKVEFGAIVITKTQNLFISIGLGKIELNKKIYYAISPAVPIYKIIDNLKPGDKYTFNGKNHEIVKIV